MPTRTPIKHWQVPNFPLSHAVYVVLWVFISVISAELQHQFQFLSEKLSVKLKEEERMVQMYQEYQNRM